MKQGIVSLQYLRAISIIYVVLFHSGKIFGLSMFRHGYTGVLLFFIISGFIISLVHREDRGLADSVIFFKKRAARIYAPYWPVFAAVCFLFWFGGYGSDYQRDPVNVFRNLFLIQQPGLSIHPYSWSLVFEVYYYLAFGILAILFRIRPLVLAGLISVPVLFHLLSAQFSGSYATANTVPVSSFNLYFVAGLVMGNFYKPASLEFKLPTVIVSFTVFISVPFLFESLGAVLLATSQFFFVVLYMSPIRAKWALLMGNASYSIYLCHGITLPVLKNLISGRDLLWFVIFLAISLGAGLVYHITLERRLVRYFYRILSLAKKVEPRKVTTTNQDV